MSILLDSRTQNRENDAVVCEGIVQQPGSFYNGNPSSSIWGRNTNQMASFWRDTTGSTSTVGASLPFPSFDFGLPVQVDAARSSAPPPPVDTLEFARPSASKEPEVFVFGSSSKADRASSSAAGNHEGGFSFVGKRVPSFNTLSGTQSLKEVEQVETMLHTMQLGPDASVAPVFSSVAEQSSKPGAQSNAQSFSRIENKTFAVGSGGKPALYQSSMNPRPRFSKLRKSTHPAKDKSIASGDVTTSPADLQSVSGTGLSSQSFTFNSRASSESANYHAGEPSLSAEGFYGASSVGTPGPVLFGDIGAGKQPRHPEFKQDQNDPSAGHQNLFTDKNTTFGSSEGKVEPRNVAGNQGDEYRSSFGNKVDSQEPFRFQASSEDNLESNKCSRFANPTSSFTFSAMGNSVPEFQKDPAQGHDPQQFEEDAKSVAAELGALKIETETGTNSKFCSRPGHPFVFAAGSNTPSHAGGAQTSNDSSATGVSEDTLFPSSESFVFRASADVSTPTASKKKKDKAKKMPSKLQKTRSLSPAVADEQGSPMDFSPCPDTGAQMSPSRTANNSEAEEDQRPEPWNTQFQSYAEPSDVVEELRAAAADLSLGNESEEVSRSSSENPGTMEGQSPSTIGGFFAFTASSPAATHRRRSRRIAKMANSRAKTGVASQNINPARNTEPAVLKHDDYGMDQVGVDDLMKSKPGLWRQPSVPNAQRMDPSSPTAAARAAAEQACERWRLRGNQAYANGDFPKAEEYYSRGASSVPPNEASQSCIRASMLCYSNRAATRMVVGRMREALADCMRAMAVDPNFLRVRLRAGSCHLALGEIEAAASYFKDCLCRARDHERTDLKIASEASEGLRKAQQVEEYFQRVRELLSRNNSLDFGTALRLLNEALLSSPYSENLLVLKARSLFYLRKYDEVILVCEQTLSLAERNWIVDPQSQVLHGCSFNTLSNHMPKAWRSWMTSKALFHLGRLEDALDRLQKLGEHMAISGSNKISQAMGADMESLSQFNAFIHDLLRHKAAGNEAFQAGRHTEAVEHYSAALALNGESRPFNAVLFCNRAAASQVVGHIADAIADCSRAVVLDPKYAKAISRRATLHDLVRDYGQSCGDLRRLISLLEMQQEQDKDPRKSGSAHQDLRQARERLGKAEEDFKKNHPIDHYLILGVEPSCTAVEIKKAYRKLALRHHPDKAGQLLVRGDGADDGNLWKEVGEEIRHDAERLFKLIGEAYAILSDPSKRSRYNAEEELRKLRTRGVSSSSSENHRYQQHYERTGRRQRDRWDTWSGYTHQHQRWQSGPDAAQPDTYARQGRYSKHSTGGRSSDFNWDDL